MIWVYIIAAPILLGLACTAFVLGVHAVCRRFAPDFAKNDWFPVVAVSAFLGALLFFLPIFEAWQR